MSMPEPSPFLGAPAPLRPEPSGQALEGRAALLDAITPAGKRAVVYLRVSTKDQVNTDYDPEGISIPAQRLACERKAEQLGLTVVSEYVELGKSAREMKNRVEFQAMLERIRRDRDVDAVIVYKLSRMARDRVDDALVAAELRERGVTLISATESIDATPVGQLMHGILAAFNEYRSREDGADIAYKMAQKAKNGGTLGKAPVGYLNMPEIVDGRRFNSVIIDPERGPFVKTAFDLYETGDYSFQDIADELSERGFQTRPTERRPAGPISDTKIHQLLKDRYYIGEVTYKEETFAGRHEPLIDRAQFERVQRLMETRGYAAERRRTHDHYLKGSIWCGQCRLERQTNSRMIIAKVKKGEITHDYFFCRGTQDQTCDIPYSSMERVEAAIEVHYKTIRLSKEFTDAVRELIQRTMADQEQAQFALRKELELRRQRLIAKESNLITLVEEGDLDGTKVRNRIRELRRQQTEIENDLKNLEQDLAPAVEYIDAFLALLEHPDELYRRSSDQTRRELNQAIFERIYICVDDVVGDAIQAPLRELLATERGWVRLQEGGTLDEANDAALRYAADHAPLKDGKGDSDDGDALDDFLGGLLPTEPGGDGVGGSSNTRLVPLEGLEPPTLSLGRNCSSIELQRLGGKEPTGG